MIFLDANVLVYYLDETSDFHQPTIKKLQELVDDQQQLATSHHVIEEVLFVLRKLEADIEEAIERISKIPSLTLVEPSPSIEFSRRYAHLSAKLDMGVNDALLLQLMLDAGLPRMFSYDKKFLKQAQLLNILGV